MIITCALCDLPLGEADNPCEIVCPLCVWLRGYVKHAITQELSLEDINMFGGENEWESEILAKHLQASFIVGSLLKHRSLDIPLDPVGETNGLESETGSGRGARERPEKRDDGTGIRDFRRSGFFRRKFGEGGSSGPSGIAGADASAELSRAGPEHGGSSRSGKDATRDVVEDNPGADGNSGVV